MTTKRKAFLSLVGVFLLSFSVLLGALPTTTHAATFTNWPVTRNGDSGENVWTIQYMLLQRGYSLSVDGAFGSGTESVVKSFQSSRGLTADGIVGNNTWEALIVTSVQGANGNHVKALQRQLNQAGYNLTVDGIYGSGTELAVRDFKTKNSLAPDGGAGLTTWNKLVVGGGTGGSTTRAGIAQDILNSGRATFWRRHDSGVVDQATASHNINDTAAGLAAKRSSYGTAPGGTVYLDVDMLKALRAISGSYRLDISELAGGSHSATSYHYRGTAFDVAMIDGRGVSSSHPSYRAVMQLCRNYGAIEVLGPGDAGHATHLHCAWN